MSIIVDIDGTIADNMHRQSVVDMWRRNGLICLQNEPKYC